VYTQRIWHNALMQLTVTAGYIIIQGKSKDIGVSTNVFYITWFCARKRSAQVLPLLKKAELDRSLPVNYRPISNLSTVSKALERLVLTRLRPHLTNSKNFSKRQSAYRQGHSTEDCAARCPWQRPHCGWQLGSHIAYWPRSLRSLWHGLSLDTGKAAADRVRSVWDCTILDSVISTGPDTVCEARAASVFWNHPGSRSTPRIRTWSAAVRWEWCHLWRQYPSRMSTCWWQILCEFSASLSIVAWLSITTR